MSRKLITIVGALVLGALAWLLTRAEATHGAEAEVVAAREATSTAPVGTRQAAPPAGALPIPSSPQIAAPPQDRDSAAAKVTEHGSDSSESQPVASGASGVKPTAPARFEPPPPPHPTLNEEKKGSVDREAIRGAIKAALPEVRDCFQQALAHDPSIAGKVVVELELETRDGQGTVMRGEVLDTETRSPFFEACVLQKVAGTKFPAPEGGGKVVVRYPFHFDPGGGFGGDAP